MRKDKPSTKWLSKWKSKHKANQGIIQSHTQLLKLLEQATKLYLKGATPELAGSITAKEQRVAQALENIIDRLKSDRSEDWTHVPNRGNMIPQSLAFQ